MKWATTSQQLIRLGMYKWQSFEVIAYARGEHVIVCWWMACVTLAQDEFHFLLAIGKLERSK